MNLRYKEFNCKIQCYPFALKITCLKSLKSILYEYEFQKSILFYYTFIKKILKFNLHKAIFYEDFELLGSFWNQSIHSLDA